MPSYNSVQYLSEAITSVLRQDYVNFELIISDNASTDGSDVLAQSFRDPRIRFFRNDHNLGYVANLNRCVKESRGEFLAFLCSDDIWKPSYLNEVIESIEGDVNTTFIHSGFHHFGDRISRGATAAERWPSFMAGVDFFRAYVRGVAPVCLSSVTARRRDVIAAGGFEAAFGAVTDSAMWLRLALHGDVRYVPRVLVGYRLHDSSLTNVSRLEESLGVIAFQRILEWPEVSGFEFADLKNEIPKASALRVVRNLHNIRGVGSVSASLYRAIRLCPLVLAKPSTWFRMGFSLSVPYPLRMWLLRCTYKFR